MKRFLLQIFLFIWLVPVFTYIHPVYLVITGKYKKTGLGKEVYHSVYKSKQKTKTKKLLLGDSVAQQIFSNKQYNDTINSLACNMAIGMIGQFLLLNNYIDVGNRPDTVYMFFTPITPAGSSFSNNLNQQYTFHYFLKPFYIKEYIPLFTQTAQQQIEKIPFYFLCQEPHIVTSSWSPEFYPDSKTSYTFLSPISVEYLKKIKNLSIQYGFQLVFIPTPVSITNKHIVEKIDTNEIIHAGLKSEFNNYLNNIVFYNDTIFSDGIHLKNPAPYTEYYKHAFFQGNSGNYKNDSK